MSFNIAINELVKTIDTNTRFGQVLATVNIDKKIPVVLAKQNGKYFELSDFIVEDGNIEFVDITEKIGMDTYKRTAQFVFIKATLDIFKDAKISVEHSINKGIYGEIKKDQPLSSEDLVKIKNKMLDIISLDILIEKVKVKKEEAIKIFEKYNMEDRVRILKYVANDYVSLYKIEDRYDYFYGEMAYSTGVLKTFDLLYYNTGFIIRLPRTKKPNELPIFNEQKKLYNVFKETANWLNILEIADVGALNTKFDSIEIQDIIRVSEALHEKKIAFIADMFCEVPERRVILVAGPSSSGKTTFTKRLSVQLRVNGLKPLMISLDDYFIDRDKTPKDCDGNLDFECLEALDLKLFNENLKDLLEGKKVLIPTYNFKTGKRESSDKYLELKDDEVLLIEGIHGLNDRLTRSIDDMYKFKIYISALTQLNLDNHNKISTTDVRKIRRIVRDSISRGHDAERTLEMWPSIKRGEEKNIFIYQEDANIMFNSTLVYELSVLKTYALRELDKVSETSPVYYEAKRLKAFLKFFRELSLEDVPSNSILREFIGGSCFYDY